jgi:citrate synthase
MAYKYSVGQPYMYPRNDLSYGKLHAHDVRDTVREYKVNDVLVRARPHFHPACRPRAERVDADGPPVRRRAPIPSLPSPPAACLWGLAHGGANGPRSTCSTTSRRRGVAKVGEFIAKVKDKNSNVKLMGFGHRVYRTTIRAPN